MSAPRDVLTALAFLDADGVEECLGIDNRRRFRSQGTENPLLRRSKLLESLIEIADLTINDTLGAEGNEISGYLVQIRCAE